MLPFGLCSSLFIPVGHLAASVLYRISWNQQSCCLNTGHLLLAELVYVCALVKERLRMCQ